MSLLEELKVKVGQYAKTADGAWLNDIDWANIPVKFIDKFPWDISGIYGFRYIFLHRADVSTIFMMYIHELYHRWQWKKNPLKYIIGKLYRPLIENDADREQQKADDWFCEMADKMRE